MIARIVVLLLIFSCGKSFATPFQYQIGESFQSPSLLALSEIQQVMEKSGLWSIDLKNTGRLDIIGVDQVYFDSTLNSKIFIKFGLTPNLKNPPFEMSIADGWVSHFKSRDGIPFAVFFKDVDSTTRLSIRRALDGIAKKSRQQGWLQLLNSLVQKNAYAAAPGCEKAGHILGNVKNALDEVLTFQFLSTCALAAVKGATSTVTGPFEALKKLASDPNAFWKNASQEFENMKKFVLHIKDELKSLGQAFLALDAKTIGEIGCTLIGEAISSALIGVVTAGAGALVVAKTMTKITLLVQKIAASSALLTKINRLKSLGIIKNQNLVNDVVSCAIRE